MPLVKPFDKKSLKKIVAQVYDRYKTTETSVFLDKLKDLGFKYSTISGLTISMADIVTSKNKMQFVDKGQEVVDKINKQFKRGLITNEERYTQVCEVWQNVKNQVADEIIKYANEQVHNPFIIMKNSGARGNDSQFNQISGMRGLMAKPNGESLEIPITANFREGLSVNEFFLSTHGARKGNADTALKTANSGYLTRRLVDVVQDIIVKDVDCGSIVGLKVTDLVDSADGPVVESLEDRIVGRFAAKKIINPETKEVIVDKDEEITELLAKKITKAGIKSVEIRSILTCKSPHGVCCKCYGRNLATGLPVELGETVGIMAAQSIGEPGTQLTMRTFHEGGVAGGGDITQGLPRVEELFEARTPKGKATIAEITGKITLIEPNNGRFKIIIENDVTAKEHLTNYAAKLCVEVGDEVASGDRLTEGPIAPKELLAATDPITTQTYILEEVQKVYKSQGVDVSDKHIEIVVGRMINKMKIVDSNDSDMVEGLTLSMREFAERNKSVILEGKVPATGKPVLLGITKSSLETDSFLSAASFQETTRVLTDASINGKIDYLRGLKENAIVGKLIPAGTGASEYQDFDIELEKEFLYDDPNEVLEDKFIDDNDIKETEKVVEVD